MTEHNCDDVLAQLDVYLDRELDGDALVHIEAHLRACAPCLEAFDFEAELRKLIAKGCREKAPEALIAKIRDAIADCDDH